MRWRSAALSMLAAPGHFASFDVYGMDWNPPTEGRTACPVTSGFLVTPPDGGAPVSLSLPEPYCQATFDVAPLVRGRHPPIRSWRTVVGHVKVSATTLVPALHTHDPKVVVTPSTGLDDGQAVEVAASGFDAGGKFWISECASPQDARSAGCGPQLPGQPFLTTDTSGAGAHAFTVISPAATTPYDTSSVRPCTNRCVIVVTVGIGYAYAYAPIAFANG